MEYILAILLIPVTWIIASRFIFSRDVTTAEICVQFLATILFVTLGYYISKAYLTSDVEILNGQVTSKDYQHVSCSHSYRCNCYTTYSRDSKGRTTSEEHCSTCYEHSYDVDWNVYSTIGNFGIDRIDSQGLIPPPRWLSVEIGEPASKAITYENFIKGAKFSIFNYKHNELDAKFKSMIPPYPTIYDYYRIHRVVPVGVPVANAGEINFLMNSALRTVGPTKQVNVLLVIANTTDTSFRYALERTWIGGKKNDVIVVLGMTHYPIIDWADTITLGKNADNELLHVKMRDDLLKLHSIENSATLVNTIISIVNSDFHRKHMKDYAYLKSEIQPSMAAMIIIAILALLSNIGVTILFIKNSDAGKYDNVYRHGRY